MATKLKNTKAKALNDLQGLTIIVYFKASSIIEEDNTVGKGVAGYLVKVDDHFLYMGSDVSQYDTMIDIEDVGVVRIPDDVDQIVRLIGGIDTPFNPEDVQ